MCCRATQMCHLLLLLTFYSWSTPSMAEEGANKPLLVNQISCDGDYQHHLQGVCIDDHANVFWSFTTQLVKTDHQGKILQQIAVANHHGDLCFVGGKVFVAVNLGEFNNPQGKANSWVYVYDADSLEFLTKHETQEVVYGAGGIGSLEDRFYVVGGLPDGVQQNYVYEYDAQFRFQKKHTLDSRWTELGIQTATFHDGNWWFGCYGTPKILLRTDREFKHIERYEFDCSLGIVGVAPDRLLYAKGPKTATGRCMGTLHLARTDPKLGLVPHQE